MTVAGLESTVQFYTSREADLTSELSNIMFDITQASKDSAKLAQQTGDKRKAVKETYDYGTEEYDDAMDEVQQEYQLELAQITEWETELETKKNCLETEIQAVNSYKESFTSALKQNVQTDFKYGQS